MGIKNYIPYVVGIIFSIITILAFQSDVELMTCYSTVGLHSQDTLPPQPNLGPNILKQLQDVQKELYNRRYVINTEPTYKPNDSY